MYGWEDRGTWPYIGGNQKKVEPLGWTFFERKTRLKLATLSLEG